MGLLNLWPVAPAGAPDFKVTAGGDGVAQVLSSPLQSIREDFGTARLDHVFSNRDSASAIYTVDDSYSNTATPLDPFSTDLLSLREQVFSLQETHVFSPTLLNTARFGFSRAGYFFTGEPTPGTPAATRPGLPGGASRRRGGGWRQPGFQSASAVGTGGKQQRQQSARRSQSVSRLRTMLRLPKDVISFASVCGFNRSNPTRSSRSASSDS